MKTVNLALQGGGAHGAFAWGVLDRILEDGRIGIEGISATSAGAMNAVVTAYGFTIGGNDGAREQLALFWKGVSEAGRLSPLQPSPWEKLMGDHSMTNSPAFAAFDLMTRMLSPYQFNPWGFNPLRDVLWKTVDFERLRAECPIKLYICATNVRTGKVRIFETREMTGHAVLASGCLPFLFQSVEIDGDPYWDGGYMGNPAIFPLIYGCDSKDVVIVHINPLERPGVPHTAAEIMNRINEISFNSSLMREMRAIAFVSKLIDDGTVPEGKLKRMFIHAVEAFDEMRALGVNSKLNADWDFLCHLRDIGRRQAEEWLGRHFDAIGRESSVDIRETYL